jgi:hypothetical protein
MMETLDDPLAGLAEVHRVLKSGGLIGVRTFGLGRAADCRDEWYVGGLTERGFADRNEIEVLEHAWTTWAESPDLFAAFAWGRATGKKS